METLAKEEAANSRQSMRAFLSDLKAAGGLISVSDSVSVDYEIAGCLAEADTGPALHFPNLGNRAGGRAMPVVGNLLNSLSRLAMGLGTTIREMQAALIA
ncbi:MAG TPA: hypothetical protein VMU69_20130, partial [Bradyrhizobium sp.]|nr:hypothetical protein [Bradyrhizobium sp.]